MGHQPKLYLTSDLHELLSIRWIIAFPNCPNWTIQESHTTKFGGLDLDFDWIIQSNILDWIRPQTYIGLEWAQIVNIRLMEEVAGLRVVNILD